MIQNRGFGLTIQIHTYYTFNTFLCGRIIYGFAIRDQRGVLNCFGKCCSLVVNYCHDIKKIYEFKYNMKKIQYKKMYDL